MSDVKFTVGGRFIDAWHRAEQGERVHERPSAFESWETLSRLLTGNTVGEFIVLPVCQ